MCQRCVNNLIDLLPNDWPWDKRMDVLWGFTAFPAGDADTVERQLKEYVTALDRQEQK